MDDADFCDTQMWTHGAEHMGERWWKVQMMQARRGDLHPILLHVLTEKPMHGYEIIRYLEEQTHGMWRPSPGSVYPTLQMLEEEELVASQESNGKKVYSLTDKGKAEAKRVGQYMPWQHNKADFECKKQLRQSFVDVAQAFRGIVKTRDNTKAEQAAVILQDTAAQLNRIAEGQLDDTKERSA
jgi:DNA-binding PadR family transcriptional regulator